MYSFRLREKRVVAFFGNDYAYVGSARISDDGFMHFEVECGHRRRGIMTTMVDILISFAPRWCDDPEVPGNCFMTADGQAFSDSYRLQRGIPLPPTMWVGDSHPAEGRKFWGRKLISREP